MAGGGYKNFTTGEVLTASDVQDYLMDQSVMVFGGTAARGSAIASPTEGMVSYLSDSDEVQVYDGSSWSAVGGGAAVLSNTPTGTYTDGDGVSWAYYEFTASGTATVTQLGEAEILVVGSGAGGAGGSGSNYGSGGGSGGSNYAKIILPAASYTIYIAAGGAAGGAGAAGGLGTPCHFGIGTDSRISSGNAQGGLGPANVGGLSATGFSGGTNSGGGGGATAVGSNNGGPGGAGYTTSIKGTSATYGVGGDGGGAGSAIPGAANTGNGGGAGRLNVAGGSGGSGIVIIRVRT